MLQEEGEGTPPKKRKKKKRKRKEENKNNNKNVALICIYNKKHWLGDKPWFKSVRTAITGIHIYSQQPSSTFIEGVIYLKAHKVLELGFLLTIFEDKNRLLFVFRNGREV